MTLLLASGSPRRKELLAAAGIPFDVGPSPDIDETVSSGLEPGDVAEDLAYRKLEAVIDQAATRPVLTADTLVFLDGRPLGKPDDAADARAMLTALSDREHLVVTGIALAAPTPDGGLQIAAGHAGTTVRFRALGADEIAAYVATGEPLDKAGAYAIQAGARGFVADLHGPEDNVIGLPIDLVRELLEAVRAE